MNDLAQQYRETSLTLSKHRKKLKEQAKVARGDEYFSLQKRIELITEEIYELDRIHAYLRKYS